MCIGQEEISDDSHECNSHFHPHDTVSLAAYEDPDTMIIHDTCKLLIGAKVSFHYSMTLKDGTKILNDLHDCNIVGNCLENIIFPCLQAKIPTFPPLKV